MTNYLKGKGMKKLAVKSVNYEKVKRSPTGTREENPAVFERRLMEAFRKYTYVDPSSQRDWALWLLVFS